MPYPPFTSSTSLTPGRATSVDVVTTGDCKFIHSQAVSNNTQCLNCGKRSGRTLTSERSAVAVEGVSPSPPAAWPGEWRSVVSSPSGVWGGAPTKLNMVYFSHKICLLVTFFTKMMTGNGDRKVQTTLLTIRVPLQVSQKWGNAVSPRPPSIKH